MGKPDYKDYEHFSSRDLICDPFFQEWSIDPTAERVDFWNGFLLQYPAAKERVEVARAFLQRIDFWEEFPAAEMVAASFQRHMEAIAAEAAPPPLRKMLLMSRWRMVAAAVVAGLLITVAATYYFSGSTKNLHQTEYGSKESIVLPDGSTVMLNANSTLEYTSNWKGSVVREVWLRGEGFFEVKKAFQQGAAQAPQKFRVYTNDLIVEVLGTSFDIRERRGITEVVLGSGKIELVFRNPAHGKITMKPGDRVVYDPRQQQVLQDTTNAADYSAWKKNKLILKNPTVNEIARYLEDNFGYRIQLEDQRMGNRIIKGPILYDSLDDALFILSTVLNTQIIKKDSTIILRPR